MNNKFWRDVFDQISSLVLIFRKETSGYELMFVNKAVQSYLGYKPELYVMESEQTGELRAELEEICTAAIGGETRIPFTMMSGQKASFSVSVSEFFSESIKESLLVMTVQSGSNDNEAQDPSSGLLLQTQLMKTIHDRISQSLELGANIAFVGSPGSGKRYYLDKVMVDMLKSDDQIVKMDYSSGKLVLYCDGVQSDFDHLMSLRKSKPVAVVIYEMQQMSKSDQKKLYEWSTQGNRNVRFIVGSKISPDQMVAEGKLDAELYYSMNLTSVLLPGLNQRRSEIQPYAEAMIRKICEASGVAYPQISAKEWSRLFNHDYENNFDELNTIILRSVIRADKGSFQFELSEDRTQPTNRKKKSERAAGKGLVLDIDASQGYDEHMRVYLSQVLERTGGKIYGKDGAAALLGMKPTTLQSKLEKYKVRV
jgi:hypothetical protein